MARNQGPDIVYHFLTFYNFNGYLTAVVQVFVGPNHVTNPSLVCLGITKQQVGHWVHQVMYYTENTEGHGAELSELPDVKLVRVEP